MNKFLMLLCFVPTVMFGQLNKVFPDMTPEEVQKALPGVYRDWEMEALTISDVQPLGKIPGTSKWKLMRDTIRNYWFKSEPKYGPSVQFPKRDSTDVHAMKVELEKLRVLYETDLGRPTQFINANLTTFPRYLADIRCYAAIWEINGKTVALMISRDYLMDDVVNASAVRDKTPAEVYTMEIVVDYTDHFFETKYGIGLTGNAFKSKYPELAEQVIPEDMPSYTLSDSATCPDAEWGFEFDGGEMWSMGYGADYGTAFGAASDEEAYLKLKSKAERLLAEGNEAYGAPDSISNKITTGYKPESRQVSYTRTYLYVRWIYNGEPVEMEFMEIGGGKNTNVRFTLYLDYYPE